MPSFADDLVCDSGIGEMYAFFSPKNINCDANQFLPANSINCMNCPNGYSCNGGELTFNEQKSSGIDWTQKITSGGNNVCSTNFPAELYAMWTPKTILCNAGYYLPMNSVSCSTCTIGNKCIGGTYTFNETTDQGIEPCPNGTYAPGGTAYCYPHILHIGDDVVYLKSDKLTTPSLNIGMNDGIFYANMTTIPTYMNRDSEHYLKLEFNNTIYYVCDDTTCGE